MRNNLSITFLASIVFAFCIASSQQGPLRFEKPTGEAALKKNPGPGIRSLPRRVTATMNRADGQGSPVVNTGGAIAAVGNPINSFGDKGIVKINFYGADDATGGAKTFLQEDGKLLVVVLEHGKPILKRFAANGSADASFGDEGDQYQVPINLNYRDAVSTPEGKIIFVGHANPGEDNEITGRGFAVGFYTSWGGNQVNETEFYGDEQGATAAALQSDGKLVVAGYTTIKGVPRFALARYHPNLSPDLTFSADGKQTTPPGPSGAIATDVVIQADGKILVGGHGATDDGSSFELIRYNSNGSRDLSFSGDGKVSTAIGAIGSGCTALALQSDGKILATGRKKLSAGAGSGYDFATVRYNINGTLDTTFSRDGMVTTSLRAIDEASAVLVQEDGKIVVAGKSRTGAVSDFSLVRYTMAGSLDASFSGDGKNTSDFSGRDDHAAAALLQPDGKIVLTGWSDPLTNGFRKIAVARYLASGALDKAFGEDRDDGLVALYFSNRTTEDPSTAVQPDGKIVVAGMSKLSYQYGWDRVIALARLHPNGTFDASFGVGGKTVMDVAGGYGAHGKALAIQGDGKIIVAGHMLFFDSDEGGSWFFLTRFQPDGKPDMTYGIDGIATTNFSGENAHSAELTSVVAQPDGKLIAMGRTEESYKETWEVLKTNIALARYNLDGSADSSFDGDGKMVLSYGFPDIFPGGLAVQPDGKIVIGGGSNSEYLIARFHPDGTPDLSFSGDGVQETGFFPRALALQGDGKLVVSGSSSGDFATARYLANGGLDPSFNGTGIRLTDFGSGSDQVNAVEVQPDGKILAAGTNGPHFTLARYLPNGALDGSFSDDGRQFTDIASRGDGIRSIARSGSTLYAAGWSVHPPFGTGMLAALVAYDLGDVNPPVTAKSIKVNLYGGSNPFANPEWNNWNVSGSLSSGALAYSDASSSGISASITKHTLADNGAAYGGTMCPPEVLRYASYSTTTRSMTLSGLAPSKTYSLQLFASRANTGNSTTFTIGATSVTILTDNNKTNVASFSSLVPSAGGQIVLSIASVNTYNYLNGFILTENAAPAPPAAVLLTGTLPGGNTSEATVAAQAPGARKGSFESAVRGLQVRAFPNPSSEHFTFVVQSSEGGSVDLRIVDAVGRVVERKQNIAPNTTLTMGRGLKAGSYFLQAVQGSQTRSIKLLRKE